MLIQDIYQLTTHHYVSRNQSNYLKYLKVTLEPNQAIITLNFAENYSFIVQDTIQNFHWNNSQATLHTFEVYYGDGDNKVCNIILCIISDRLKHDSVAVHSVIKVALKYFTLHVCPTLTI